MTFGQMIVAYAVCWWLVLFMVLPSGAQPEANPAPGHARSAPANPRLRRKFWRTTWIAVLPTVLIFLIASQAKAAEESMYRTGHGCVDSAHYVEGADVATRDGYGTGGKRLVGANLSPAPRVMGEEVDLPLEIPSAGYLDRSGPKRNVDLSESRVKAGSITITKDGSILLNGQPISDDGAVSDGCE